MVAAPRTWDELSRGVADPSSLQQLSYQQVLARIDSMGDLLAAQSS
jgi:DNA primase